MEVNQPEVVAEVQAAYDCYERALQANDVAVLDRLFWNSPLTVRYGLGENLHGFDEIAAFRAAVRAGTGRPKPSPRTVIATFGRDFATVNVSFARDGEVGRQSQAWARTPEGWRIVSAHVSRMARGPADGVTARVLGTADALGIPIRPEHVEGVVESYTQIGAQAQMLMEFSEAAACEPAAVFRP